MKVKELIEYLNTLPKESEVFLSTDEEGNAYGKIAEESYHELTSKKQVVLYPNNLQPYFMEFDKDNNYWLE